jgi:hypothetical protein
VMVARYHWRTIRCRQCGRRHQAERPNAIFCSPRCKQAHHRDLKLRRHAVTLAVEGIEVAHAVTRPPEAGGFRGFQRVRFQHPLLVFSHLRSGSNSAGDPLVGNDPRLNGQPFTFDEDTIPGRKWRVAEGWLQVEVMGGHTRIFEIADSTDLARRLAWLSGANVRSDPAGASAAAGPASSRANMHAGCDGPTVTADGAASYRRRRRPGRQMPALPISRARQ